jgi:hypothetical protein
MGIWRAGLLCGLGIGEVCHNHDVDVSLGNLMSWYLKYYSSMFMHYSLFEGHHYLYIFMSSRRCVRTPLLKRHAPKHPTITAIS